MSGLFLLYYKYKIRKAMSTEFYLSFEKKKLFEKKKTFISIIVFLTFFFYSIFNVKQSTAWPCLVFSTLLYMYQRIIFTCYHLIVLLGLCTWQFRKYHIPRPVIIDSLYTVKPWNVTILRKRLLFCQSILVFLRLRYTAHKQSWILQVYLCRYFIYFFDYYLQVDHLYTDFLSYGDPFD